MAPIVTKRKNIQFALAKVYEGGPITNMMYAEPKLDGLRGAILIECDNICEALTRTGLPIPNARVVVQELVKSGNFNNTVLDGEFMGRDWNESQSIVKKQSAHPDINNLMFYVFDLIPLAQWVAKKASASLEVRKADLKTRLSRSAVPHTSFVEHVKVYNKDEAEVFFKKTLKLGFEGIMLKDPATRYSFKKSWDWMKYKPFLEGDFIITGAVEGRGKHAGRLGALQITNETSAGVEQGEIQSEVGTGFNDTQRQELWNDHLAGKLLHRTVEVEYQEITEDGALRFPAFRRMRDDK